MYMHVHCMYNVYSVCLCCPLCRYNDPPYVKMKKVELLTELCNVENAENIVNELGYRHAYSVCMYVHVHSIHKKKVQSC